MRYALKAFAFAWCLVACGRAPGPEPTPVPDDVKARADYADIQSRIDSRFLDQGFVVSIGKNQRKGDSLLWTGIAAGTEDCKNQTLVSSLWEAVHNWNGALARHPDLPDKISLDGAMGFYWGVATRIKRCPKEALAFRALLSIHQSYMDAHKRAVNGSFRLPVDFGFIQDALFSRVDLGPSPDRQRMSNLANEVSAWVEADKLARAPCYRAHVAWLTVTAGEALGYPLGQTDRKRFCQAADGLGIVLIDHWCGHGELKTWLNNFKYDRYEYFHQRCPAWEGPDAGGDQTPGVDQLIGLQQEYGF